MISGISEEWNDFPNPYRIAINNVVCGIGCFNDKTLPINRDWNWCGRNKNFICTKEITEQMVIKVIEKLRKNIKPQKIKNVLKKRVRNEKNIIKPEQVYAC